MIKPKPCPFCGGKVAVVICDDEGNLHDDDYLLIRTVVLGTSFVTRMN